MAHFNFIAVCFQNPQHDCGARPSGALEKGQAEDSRPVAGIYVLVSREPFISQNLLKTVSNRWIHSLPERDFFTFPP